MLYYPIEWVKKFDSLKGVKSMTNEEKRKIEEIKNMSMEEKEKKNNELLKEWSILDEKIKIRKQPPEQLEGSMRIPDSIRYHGLDELEKKRAEIWAEINLLGDNFGI